MIYANIVDLLVTQIDDAAKALENAIQVHVKNPSYITQWNVIEAAVAVDKMATIHDDYISQDCEITV